MPKLHLLVPLILLSNGLLTSCAQKTHLQSDCIGCHSQKDVMPGLFEQYSMSKHSEKNVACEDCHGATKGESDSFIHEGSIISLIVTPNDCKKCHEKAVEEFNQSEHHKARRLVTTGIGGYFLKNLEGSEYLSHEVKYAGGITGCLRCHGSKIELDASGHPTPETWPSSGIARENPDGSTGNCAACHESHEFSVAQARQPESCGICHNNEGGDPKYEAYNSSRHGTTYHTKTAQMNLDADRWIAGQDYFAAPTCATCHMSAINEDLPVTHNINTRVGWNDLLHHSNTIAVEEKCGPLLDDYTGYEQPSSDPKHQTNMEQVCLACHSKGFVKNFNVQYESEVKYILQKWIRPGKELFRLITNVFKAAEKERYQLFTHPIDFTWWGMCNANSKNSHIGASMMSAGRVEIGNGGFVSNWYTGFVPQIEGIINNEDYLDKAPNEVKALQNYFEKNIKNNKVYFGPWN